MRTKCIVWLTLWWLAGSACDSDFGTKTSGQACTRASQCAEGLWCRKGACEPRKKASPAPAAQRDGGAIERDASQGSDSKDYPAEVQGK